MAQQWNILIRKQKVIGLTPVWHLGFSFSESLLLLFIDDSS